MATDQTNTSARNRDQMRKVGPWIAGLVVLVILVVAFSMSGPRTTTTPAVNDTNPPASSVPAPSEAPAPAPAPAPASDSTNASGDTIQR